MSDLNTSVVLNLKDNFSSQIAKAGKATSKFASGALSAVNKVDRAFSGAASKLAGLGVTLSAGAATKELIDLDAKMMRIGVQANVSNEKVNELKNKIYDTARAPDIKIGTDELTSALDSVIERTGDLAFAEGNLRAIGLAIQATGASGQDIGGLFAEFQKMGLGANEALKALDTLTVQGKQGAFTLQNLSSLGPRTISAYTATGRTGAGALREMGAALQVIRMGTGSSEQAATAFEAVMRNITSPDKQEKLAKLGVSVKDQAGDFKSIVDIMQEIVEKSDGSTEALGQVFDDEAMRAFNFAIGEYKRIGAVSSLKKFNEIMGDGSTIQKDAARNASTMSANLKNLQTSFMKFADKNLSGPVNALAAALNKLADDPEKLQKVFGTIAKGFGAILAVKGFAKITGTVSTLSGFLRQKPPQMGGGIASSLASPLGGSSATPVFVTNWQGGSSTSGGSLSTNAGKMTLSDVNAYNSKLLKSSAIQAGVLQTVAVAGMKTVEAFGKIQAINADKKLKGKAKTKAKGGVIGDAVGTVVGTVVGTGAGVAAGAFAAGKIGAIIGTAIAPGVGTAIGGAIGMAGGAIGGLLFGKAGKWAGEKIGEALGKDEAVPGSKSIKKEIDTVQQVAPTPPKTLVEGTVTYEDHIYVHDDRVEVKRKQVKNTTPFAYNTGNIKEARRVY